MGPMGVRSESQSSLFGWSPLINRDVIKSPFLPKPHPNTIYLSANLQNSKFKLHMLIYIQNTGCGTFVGDIFDFVHCWPTYVVDFSFALEGLCVASKEKERSENGEQVTYLRWLGRWGAWDLPQWSLSLPFKPNTTHVLASSHKRQSVCLSTFLSLQSSSIPDGNFVGFFGNFWKLNLWWTDSFLCRPTHFWSCKALFFIPLISNLYSSRVFFDRSNFVLYF